MTKSELEAAFDDMDYRFGCLLDHATGGRMSKTNYTKEVMYSGVNEYVRQCIDDEKSDIIDEFLGNLEISEAMILAGARAASHDYDELQDEWQKAAIRQTVQTILEAVIATLPETSALLPHHGEKP